MTEADAGVIIVGAGEAGAGVAFALRQNGYAGAITLIGEEGHPPYRRPPLSKGFLTGVVSEQALMFRSNEAYERARIKGLYRNRVLGIDRRAQTVVLEDGLGLPYRQLVLATGGRARRLALHGAEHPNIHYVRTIADVSRLRAQFRSGQRLMILGGGFIGLEIAAVGVLAGLKVTLAEALPRLLARVAAPVVSEFYAGAHRRRGVEILTALSAQSCRSGASALEVSFADGSLRPADLIIAGVGMIPNTELAQDAGLAVDNGILVDGQLATSDPRIFAVGDCCSYLSPFSEKRVRLESVPNAAEHARICAAAIMGRPALAHSVPWFWSDQYDLKLQIAGLSDGYDDIVIRGEPQAESFCTFYLAQGVIVSAAAVNRPADFSLAKKLVAQRTREPKARLRDETIPLNTLMAR